MSLQQLQENFQAYMLEGDESIVSEIISTDQAPAILRLDVYRNGYYLRLIDILAMDFEVLKKMLGEELFGQLAHEYVDAYSSNHFSVRHFGRHFSKFLASNPNLAPVYAEMAKFEWALTTAQDAKDAFQLSVEDISRISPESWAQMRFTMHPTVQQLSFSSNAPEIWRAVDSGEPLPEEKYSNELSHWLLWRSNMQAFFIPLSQQELSMMQSIQAGKTFAEVCEDLCDWLEEEQVIQFAAGTLRNWISSGIFSEVVLEEVKEVTV